MRSGSQTPTRSEPCHGETSDEGKTESLIEEESKTSGAKTAPRAPGRFRELGPSEPGLHHGDLLLIGNHLRISGES